MKIERGSNIVLFAVTAIVYTGAEACAAKIKSQNRNADAVQRFRRLVYHFVVHRAAKKRMRMANNGGERRMRGGRRRPENCFEPPGRSLQEKIAGFVGRCHRCAKDKFAV